MIKRLIVSSLILLTASFSMGYAAEKKSAPAEAPKPVIKKQEKIGDWELICADNPQPDGSMRDMCSLIQSIREKGDDKPFATVEITRDPSGKLGAFFNLLPIGIEFKKGITLELAKGGSVPVELRTCFPTKCVTSFNLDDKTVSKIKTNEKGQFIFQNIYATVFKIPVSFKGLDKGLGKI